MTTHAGLTDDTILHGSHDPLPEHITAAARDRVARLAPDCLAVIFGEAS